MAITHRTPTVARVSSVTSITVNKPTGTGVGDLLRVMLAATAVSTWTIPAGWALIPGTSAGDRGVAIYRVADGSEGANFTFSVTTGATLLSAGCLATVGCDTGNPFDAAAYAEGTTATALQTSQITITTGVVLDSLFIFASLSSTVVDKPTAMTQIFQNNSLNTFAGASKTATPGLSGNHAWSWTGSQSANTVMCALREANDGTVAAVKATATATAPVAVVSTVSTVNPPRAQATAAAPVPAVTATANPTVNPPRAQATAAAPVPAVTAVRSATVAPPTATATATAVAPNVVTTPDRNVTFAAWVEQGWTAAIVSDLRYTAHLASPPWTAELEQT